MGNPPYVRQERLTPIKPYLETHYATYHGVADLYTYFFELGLKLLKKGGYMGFISSSTFFKTGSGESLREFLKVESNLQTVVDFGDLQVFEGVTTYPAILVMEKPGRTRKNAPKEHNFRFLNVASTKVADLSSELQEATFGEMKQAKLGADRWRLEDERLQALRSKILTGKPTLKETYGSPLYGIKTGLMAAFVIHKETYESIINLNPQSLELMKPFLEGKDLKKWHAETRQLYLILFPKGWTKTQIIKTDDDTLDEEEAWSWLQTQHPAICEWLLPFAEKAKKRYDQGEFWWELRTCAYYDKFQKEKIIYPDITDRTKFSFDRKGYLSETTGFFISDADQYLMGLLNSPVIWFQLRNICPQIRGGFSRLKTIYMETLPIPEASEEEKAEIAQLAEECQTLAETRYKQQARIRRRIPDLCPPDREAKLSNKLKNWWELDFAAFQKEIKSKFKHSLSLKESMDWEGVFDDSKTEIQTLSLQLAQKEAVLNQAVYKLFKLNAEEIALLEASLK